MKSRKLREKNKSLYIILLNNISTRLLYDRGWKFLWNKFSEGKAEVERISEGYKIRYEDKEKILDI